MFRFIPVLLLALLIAHPAEAAKPAPKASVNILFPNGGETFPPGKRIEATWESVVPMTADGMSIPAENILGELWLAPERNILAEGSDFRPTLRVAWLKKDDIEKGSLLFALADLPEISPRCPTCAIEKMTPQGAYRLHIHMRAHRACDGGRGPSCPGQLPYFEASDDGNGTFIVEKEKPAKPEKPKGK